MNGTAWWGSGPIGRSGAPESLGEDTPGAASRGKGGRPRAILELAEERLWAIVLAGGRGARLRPLVWLVHGDARPKQYAALADSQSMLRHTLDRVALRIPPERTVVVASQEDAPYVAAEFRGAGQPHLLVQPSDRGTAAGILLPAHWISWREPDAAVAVFPSDHFVLGDAVLMDHVTALSRACLDQMLLVGAPPTEPDPGYGWIETGKRLGTRAGQALWQVQQFWEKPSPEAAQAFFAAGHLWNTFIFVAKAGDLVDIGWSCLPRLSELLAGIEPTTGTGREVRAMQQAYAQAERADFSRAVLEPCAATLAVSRLPGAVSWSDWGTPERVLGTLRKLDLSPAWLDRLDRAAGRTGLGPGSSQPPGAGDGERSERGLPVGRRAPSPPVGPAASALPT